MPVPVPIITFNFPERITLRERGRLKAFLISLFRKEKTPLAELHYIFCSDRHLLEINRQFLQHDFYTDIITFPLSDPGQPVSGEIYISVDRVRENARELGNQLSAELLRVIFHGALHLCGYKDKKPAEVRLMRQTEDKYLQKWKIRS